jgi:hypothetical protein
VHPRTEESPAQPPAAPAPKPASTPGPGVEARTYRAVPRQRVAAEQLGPLQDLPGFWEGVGFSLIARPDFSAGNPDGFVLQLNLLRETIEFTAIGSPVFNRGSRQDDVALFGVTYLHRVTDAVTGEALHIEPGLWLSIPATTQPSAGASIARLGSIPHGNAFCTVGTADEITPEGPATLPPINTVPFPAGGTPPPTGTTNSYPAYDLSKDTPFRTVVPAGITQDVVNDPMSLQRSALEGLDLTHVTRLITATAPAGGIANIPFISANADTLQLDSVFAIETVSGPKGREYLQLQYDQTALLNFKGLSFPHVTVGTLVKAF